MVLTRNNLLQRATKVVRLKSMDGEVRLQRMSAGEVLSSDGEDVGMMVARSIIDEDGNRLFSDEEKEDALGMPMPVITELMEHIAEFNGFNVVEQEKNSGSTPADGSSST